MLQPFFLPVLAVTCAGADLLTLAAELQTRGYREEASFPRRPEEPQCLVVYLALWEYGWHPRTELEELGADYFPRSLKRARQLVENY